jgi:hypothetical protein
VRPALMWERAEWWTEEVAGFVRSESENEPANDAEENAEGVNARLRRGSVRSGSSRSHSCHSGWSSDVCHSGRLGGRGRRRAIECDRRRPGRHGSHLDTRASLSDR